jgi:transposase InsO family protein
MSQIKIPIHAHPFTTSRYYPVECLNMDYVGPYPDGGYIPVIIDTFTRWVELYHSPDATAESAAWSLLQHFGRYGATTQIQSDRGPHFVANVIKEFLKLIGAEHCLTMAYSKEEYSIVERANKEVNRHIRAYTFDTNHVKEYKNATFSNENTQYYFFRSYEDKGIKYALQKCTGLEQGNIPGTTCTR